MMQSSRCGRTWRKRLKPPLSSSTFGVAFSAAASLLASLRLGATPG